MRYSQGRRAMTLDEIDRKILAELRRNGRASVTDIARAVGLSPAPVSRRIERMEVTGVIRGYTAIIDDRQTGSLEAFTEVRLTGNTETAELGELLSQVHEVQEFFTIAGDPDVLVRIRVDDVDHLQRVVNALRRTGKLTGTKTLIVMKAWHRDHDYDEGAPSG
jgi:Lrp/AsnC family leucine-responsive transcriptional regulator